MIKRLHIYFVLAVLGMILSEYFLLVELYHLQRGLFIACFIAGLLLSSSLIYLCYKRINSTRH